MRVIHIPRRFTLNAWGGTETYILEIARRLKSHDIQAEIFCPSALDSPGEEEIRGVLVRRFPYFYPHLGLSKEQTAQMDRKGGNLFSLALLQALRNEPDIDLIHLHTGKRLGGIGRHIAQSRNIPYYITVHEGAVCVPGKGHPVASQGSPEWGRALGCWGGNQNILHDAAAVIFVDREEAEKARVLQQKEGSDLPQSDRIRYLPGGVDVQRFANGNGRRFRHKYNITDHEPVVATIARIEPEKNQLDAVRAFDLARGALQEGVLLLAGPITNQGYYDHVQREIQQRGLSDSVLIVTDLDPLGQELVDAYHAADCLLLPSIHEPLGLAILEAWAAGCPVITSDASGPVSFTRHAEDVFHFPVSDVYSATEYIIRILSNSDLADSLADAGNYRARTEFSWDVITARMAQWYRETLGVKPVSASAAGQIPTHVSETDENVTIHG